MTPATGCDLACFGYLAHAQVLSITAYPPANSGAAVKQVFSSLAGDAPITGLTARRLGLSVCLVSNTVGVDPTGRAVIDAFDTAGIGHWATPTQPNGTSTPQVTVITDDAGTRTWFAWLANAADQLTKADPTPLNTARLAYIDCYHIIEAAAVTAIAAAHVPLILNLGGDPLTDTLIAATSERHIAFLQTSLDETHVDQAEQLADDLHSRIIADTAVITLGRYGALARTDTATYRTPAPMITLRHTHGAGAAFSGALAHAHLSGAPLPEALDAACRVGSAHCASTSHVPHPCTENILIKETQP